MRSVVGFARWLLVLAIGIQSLVVVGFILGPYGFGMNLPNPGSLIWEGQIVMSAEGVLREPPVVDIDLSWETTEEGTVDVGTGLPPVELDGPFTARVSFWGPTSTERVAYVASRIATPLLSIAVMWLLVRMVSSVSQGSPFTETNARRLWTLALTIGIGGTAAAVAHRWVDAWLIANSAAAPAFHAQGRFSFTSIALGLLIAVLAVAWTRGVELQKDTEGLV